jgi:hypothetical protein
MSAATHVASAISSRTMPRANANSVENATIAISARSKPFIRQQWAKRQPATAARITTLGRQSRCTPRL